MKISIVTMTNSPIATLLMRIEEYKRKFYLNKLIKGSIFSAAVLLSAFLVFNTLEYFGHFGTVFRGILFFAFVIALLASLFFWVIKPAIFLYGKQKPLSNEEAADQIGKYFPNVSDKLINTLQLSKTVDKYDNELLLASIKQKSEQLSFVKFADAIKINDNKKYVKYAAVPAVLIGLILLISPAFFTKSTERIVNFKNEYQEEAPFSFELTNTNLQAFKNEDFTIKLTLRGNTIPENVYVLHNDRKLKMESNDKRHYTYTFSKVQQDFDFQFEAAGFKSNDYEVELINRPSLAFFDVNVTYPAYLNKPAESLKNVGNLTVPEGTSIEWDFNVTDTDSILMVFAGDNKRYPAEKKLLGGGFDFTKKVKTAGTYQVFLKNKYAANKDGISFFLNVVPDKYPQLSLEQYKDSTLYNFMVLGGNIADDYGISKLAIFYKVLRDGKASANAFKSINVPVNQSQSIQSFYYQWGLDSLKLNPADKIEYYVQVWDNDGVNGAKATRSQVMNYLIPDKKAINNEIDKSMEKTEAQLDKTLEKAQKLRKELAALENRLKNKKELDYQDKKIAEEILKKREELMNDIKKLQEQNQNLNDKQQRFNEQKPENQQKMEALQKMMNDLLDPETQKMYEELKKLLDQKPEENQLMEQMEKLEKLKNKERNTEKELERMQNLFKKLQLDQKLDKAIKELDKQAEKQDQLAEKNEELAQKPANDPQKKAEADALKKEQDKLNKDFEELKKELKEAEQMNKEMKDSDPMDTGKEQQESISKDQKDAKEEMDKGDNKDAKEKQKRASRQMKALSKKLSDMKMQAEMKENEENMDDLRDILENLVKLSFDEERLMKSFKDISVIDPRFIKFSQEQLKLQDDAKVIEDSLYALSKRVLQIETFVTREMGNMKGYMNDAVRLIKERKLQMTASKQQFAMSSMNNLALLLSDVLKQMQQNQQNMASGSGKGKKKGKGKDQGKSMGESQKDLNQKMQQAMQKGAKGQGGLSEDLARMANEQGRIRKMLQQMLDNSKGTEKGKQLGDQINDMIKKMEQTETDLVNKRLNPELLKRQQEMVTRLMESEKAMQEQEEDEKRKASAAKSYDRKVPAQFQQYVKDKQKQTELLRTVPANLNPYYKHQVDTYFKKIQ